MVTNDSDADNHLRDDVNTALVRHDPLLQFGRQFIQVAVENGVVTLRGNVRNITHKNIAAERAQDVDGVAGVRNLLVDDGELLRLVGTALAAHPETSATVHGPIETFLGVVTLRGPAPSPEFAEQAPMLAAQVPGARLVLDQINAEIDDTEPSVEAVFGRRVILGGHEAGRVREVLIDRVGSQVQGVVISHGKLPSVWATLPPSVCGLSDSRYLYLDMTESEFSELPVDIHARPAGADRSALVLDRRTCVGSSWKRRLGRAIGVRFNRKTGEIRHIIVRRGWFFPVNAWLPTRALSINQGITTSLSRAEVQAVIEAGPPRAGNEVVRDAEWRLLFKRWQEMPAGRVTIGYGAGRLQLEGEMHDAVDALTVEQLVRGVHGVIGVDNRISIKQKQPRMGLAIDSAMATVPTQPLAA